MISVTPSLVVRSSLEEMLDSLQRKEDIKKPTDLPPALPARPASKARLPKRPVPAMFGVGDVVLPEVGDIRRQDFKGGGGGGGSFGRKKVLETAVGESPYTMAAVHEHRLAENGGAHLATPPPPPPSLYSGWDNSIDYFIKKQLRVWCLLQNGQWELGKIQSASGGKASVTLLDGTVMVVSTGELLPANMEILDGVDNLVGLGYLNEPSVLCNLQYRYARDTMAGPVLLAINPFKDVSISGSDVITAYREKILDSPHVYAVAEAAYSDMRRAIQYLVGAGGENSEIASKIRQTGCILEAFGNAKTSRNRSSSRFGKLIDIHYNAKGIVYGAYIHTHKLNLRMASEYKFLSRSGCLKIHGVDDAQNFKKLMEALDALQISYEDQEPSRSAARLMGCKVKDLMLALSTNRNQSDMPQNFTLPQEYESEGIDWKKVEFIDNQECLNLFEKKTVGIISILDEASNTSECTDLIFANKVRQNSSSYLSFNGERGAFRVRHYAGELENSKPHFIRCIRPNAKQLHGMYEKDIVLQQLRCGGVLETVRISKSRYPTCMTHQEFATRFGCLLSENTLCQDPLSISVAILQQYHVGVLEKRRQEVMQGTYKAENGCSVHRDFHELMSGIVTLQSFVRGENSRRGCNVLKKSSHQIAPRSPDEHLTAAVHIQSVIRGWLARRNFNHLQSWKSSADSPKTRQKSRSLVSEVKNMSQENIQILPSNVEELQKLVMKAEVSLSQREQENSALREQVRQFEVRWSEHEIKMKSVEETWQRQMASLQKSLGAAKKSLGADDDDSEDNTPKSQNPDGNTNVESGNNSSTVDELAKELERKKRNFEDDAKAIVEVKSGNMPYSKQMEEFKRVKQRFDTWKKEYKNRLRETRAKLGKGVNGEGGGSEKRARQSWWGKLSKRI
ncbi:IQ motif, EF-hand binding site-containing protein [Cynara cardunculus var. scolymus]|uniref:IQ motif, EF-hand binding site-containing protein n=1 Tax=Cynara cardunculus var. scolymus TaxID=59895 RepID=A0A118K135_CYNCS|nr:IQ motif, EF-hand binding site-containing protein [Cynara cardunculus var. scolymus]